MQLQQVDQLIALSTSCAQLIAKCDRHLDLFFFSIFLQLEKHFFCNFLVFVFAVNKVTANCRLVETLKFLQNRSDNEVNLLRERNEARHLELEECKLQLQEKQLDVQQEQNKMLIECLLQAFSSSGHCN